MVKTTITTKQQQQQQQHKHSNTTYTSMAQNVCIEIEHESKLV